MKQSEVSMATQDDQNINLDGIKSKIFSNSPLSRDKELVDESQPV